MQNGLKLLREDGWEKVRTGQTTPEEIMRMRSIVDSIYIDEKIGDYIVDIVMATRGPKDYGMDIGHLIEYGASPRATLALVRLARARALLQGRAFVIPEDPETNLLMIGSGTGIAPFRAFMQHIYEQQQDCTDNSFGFHI